MLGYQLLHPGKKLLFMGGEFAQWQEWSEERGLDWQLCDQAPNRGVQLMVKDLNHLYTSESGLYERDFEPDGFRWLDCNDSERSLLIFVRQAKNEQVVCIFNFTPVVRVIIIALDYHNLELIERF